MNYAEKYSAKVAERFTKESITKAMASNAYDWDGVKSIKVYSVDTVELGDYQRSGSSRYGTPADLTDSLQVMEMTQDKAFTYVIDAGDNAEEMNVKGANKALKRQIDERVIPYCDKYNLKAWVKGAGSIVVGASAVNKSNILDCIMDCTEKLDEALAPAAGRVMAIKNSKIKLLKECPNFVYTDALAQGAMVKNQIGEIDGMKVVRVPDSYLPADVDWLIVHQSALLAPVKLQEYKVHTNPPGINGNLTEGRILHDAFVLDAKAGAVCAFTTNASIAAANAAVAGDVNGVTIKMTAGDSIFYTLDGSDPRCSGAAVKANANVSLNAAQLNGVSEVRAVCYDANKSIAFGQPQSLSL